jgi:hypothetical protein
MKKSICLILTGIAINWACAQTETLEHEWKVTLKVVTETGQPVTGAKAVVGYYSKSIPASIEGLTDTNGIFTASHSAHSGILGFSAEKAGYYTTREPSYDLGFTYDPAKWNPTQTIVLKKIGKPIAMYARKVQIEFPETNKPIGFDLVEGDWVTPYGKGKQADFIFQAERRWVSRRDFDCAVKLTFSKPGDGLIPVSIPQNQGSVLRMSAIAPTNGYLPEISKSLSHTPANGWKDDEREGNKEENYYFRVRTAIDDRGNIVSAHYGKIYEDFALDPINSKTTWILFTYYFNSTPNDRNTEFDPKQNLMTNLKPGEGVSEP